MTEMIQDELNMLRIGPVCLWTNLIGNPMACMLLQTHHNGTPRKQTWNAL